MKKENSNLPIPTKNKFILKFKKTIFIVLSSLGLANNITNAAAAEKAISNIEQEYNIENNFKENFKVNLNKKNETIVDGILKKREEKGLGNWSQETDYEDKVNQLLINTLDKLDENFDMNANKRGTNAVNKKEFKNYIISLIENLDDIIYVDPRDGTQNQYVERFRLNENTTAFYTRDSIKNDLGVIPKNVIVLNGEKLEKQNSYDTIIHEIIHSSQFRNRNNDYVINTNMVWRMLREGHATNQSEYIRNIYKNNKDHNLNSYDIPTNIYNKLGYLIGEQKMNEIMENQSNLRIILSEELDKKYGEGTGLEMLKHITNLSFVFSKYDGNLDEKKADKLISQIEDINTNYLSKKYEETNSPKEIKELDDIVSINDNAKDMLTEIKNIYQNGKDIDSKKEKIIREEEKELEKLVLHCIEQDIEKLSNKNEVLNYVQLWDYYRNRCLTNKADIKNRMGIEKVKKEDNFKLVSKVQHQLYEKCEDYNVLNLKEVSSLNIKNEDIFNMLLEAQLYSVKDAKISITKNNTRVIISDKYLRNLFKLNKKKDDRITYVSGTESIFINTKGSSKGINILSKKEITNAIDR